MLQDLATESKNKLTLYLVKQRSIKDGIFVIITKQGESETIPRCRANFIFILSLFLFVDHYNTFKMIIETKNEKFGLDSFKNTWRG